MSHLERFHVLVDRAESEQYAPSTGPWLEEAWRIAVEAGDIPNGVLARYLYMFAVAPIEPARALVAFSWCIAHAEQAAEVLPGASLAQLYGIAIGILRSYPDYSLEQIEATFSEMERQYEKFGLPYRDILHHRIYMALSVGDRVGAEHWYTAWTAATPDVGACPACDRGTQALFHLHREEFDEGFRLAAPLLDFSLQCPHGQPLMTHAAVLVPMARQRMFDAAQRSHRAATYLLKEPGYAGIWVLGRQLGYLAMVGQWDEALALFQESGGLGLHKGTPADQFGYLLSVKSLAGLAAERGEEDAFVRALGRVGMPLPGGDSARRWVRDEVARLARAFDARNRNQEFERIVGVFERVQEELRDVRAL